ncbi:MAG: hypothetical protein KH134_23325, partial [Enterobacter cloacae]|nr:hypothetical protein [Enterobacter cloacae]
TATPEERIEHHRSFPVSFTDNLMTRIRKALDRYGCVLLIVEKPSGAGRSSTRHRTAGIIGLRLSA